MNNNEIIDWLLQGDVSIQYQVHRDLLGNVRKDLQNRIANEGWGEKFLNKRNPKGYWGEAFYQPKWISSHYTLLDLRNLNLAANNKIARESIASVMDQGKAQDGGIPLGPSTSTHSDVCVNAMFLNYASYFKMDEIKLQSIVDSILNEKMPDGGFNCISTRSGARHSSLHTTISVLEGFYEFLKSGFNYRKTEILEAKTSAEAFILLHQFYLSDHSGKIIKKDFLKLAYPSRWKYDILRALDYFQYSDHKWDNNMAKALDQLLIKRNKNRTWNMQAAHPGKVHFVMEKAGKPSRWNTLRALRVLKKYKQGV
ncbi:hypothetical protein HZR84_04730 [Hyphobacterium sp. CCMP332]|nr:hypothetical protein HZR84_04730 [Hyphobacterium sp. CCMP332]